ncbi:MAG TPA: YggT family protein [Candidatus Dormibacteraeota bacterium]
MAAVIGILTIICYAFFVLILVRVAFSWIGPDMRNPIFRISYQLTEPILAPVRNLLPQTAGIDLSPMIVTFLLFMVLNILQRFG